MIIMSTILSEIIKYKYEEVKQRMKEVSVDSLLGSYNMHYKKASLCEVLRMKDSSGIIAEFKSKSPSAGVINFNADVAEVTIGYIKAGASALSVLTDNHFFGGSFENFLAAREHNSCPILQKDFIIDEYQVYEACALGANVILLIASVLSCSEVERMSKLCLDLGMECILEIHSVDELDHLCSEISIVGINNRNLKTFDVSLSNSIEIAQYIPGNFLRIAESGIESPENVITLSKAGFDGFLIGSRFMKSPDPVKSCMEFISDLKIQRQ